MHPKFFLSILSALLFIHSYNSQCLDDQKNLLLHLKNELIFDTSTSTKLVQWNQTHDCCKWYGVECDGAGFVTSLQLNEESISGGLGDSSSLFRLKYLKKLNLANNALDLDFTPIPKGIHKLTYLTHLNMSYAGFSGQVSPQLSSLSRLVSLDISNNWVSLEHPNLEMFVQNLTGLKEFYLDRVDITSSLERRNWSHIISSYIPHLTTLSLVDCSLSGPFARSFSQLHSLSVLQLDYNNLSARVPDFFANFSNLTTLTLANCGLKGSFPNTIFQIPTLEILDLSGNDLLSGSIPPFPQVGSLKSIKMRMTNFSGFIPSSVSNIRNLSEIDLSSCNFTGPIPSTFANLTQLVYVNLGFNLFNGSLSSTMFEGLSILDHLYLGHNSFSGNIPCSLFTLPSLKKLWLNNNQFTGQLVEGLYIVNVSNIAILDLSRNRLEGPIPDSFFQLQSLESLLLLGNLFNGTFQMEKIQGLTNLTSLILSYNNLTIDVGNDKSSAYGLPQLKELGLASCNLYDFPNFIKGNDMTVLDLSNNRITGEIPSWIWGTQLERLNLSFNLLEDLQKPYHIPASLQVLDLHSNKLRGELHLLIPPDIGNSSLDLQYLLLADNYFNGSIPNSLCSAMNLDFLDLSINELSGTIPSCLFENVQVFDVGRNKISGHIPNNFSLDCNLKYFNLNNNSLEGGIPKSLESCKQLEFMNVGNNIINDTFPCMLPSNLHVLVLHSNRFHGEVRCIDSWPDLQILDISSNNFSGSFESINISSWRAMVLGRDAQLGREKLSYYSTWSFGVTLTVKGLEAKLVKIWPEFTSVDLSSNNFEGEIPTKIGDLSLLYLLNLSHNALNGSIPKSFGRLRNLESLDLSQNRLTGAIPMELAGLTFLSFLNVSYNELVGVIPKGSQFQTFPADSFNGNPGLCGSNLNKSCYNPSGDEVENEEEKKREIEWTYVTAALGYVVGVGSIVWLLVFRRSFRKKYFDKIDEVVDDILDARNRRRLIRRRNAIRVRENRVI